MQKYFTLVDRYFIRQFLWTTLACFAIVVILFVLLTLFFDLDGLFELFDRKPGPEGFLILCQFYTVRVMTLLHVLGMGFIMCGVAFTFYVMEGKITLTMRGGETFPLLTMGFSRWRIARPFTIAGVAMILLMHGGLELFFSECRDWPGANSRSFLPKTVVSIREKRDPTSGIEIKGRSVDLHSGVLAAPKFVIPTSVTNSYIGLLMAETATWMPAEESHPSGYMLENLRNLTDEDWLPTSSYARSGENQIFFRHENEAWVPDGAIFVASIVRPIDLNASSNAFVPDSIAELIRKLSEPTNEVQYSTCVQIHSRIVKPLLDICFWFIMVPIILTARIRYKVTVLFLLLILFGTYMAVPQIFAGLGENGLIPPFMSMWISTFLFGIGATILFEEFYT